MAGIAGIKNKHFNRIVSLQNIYHSLIIEEKNPHIILYNKHLHANSKGDG